MVSSSSSDSDSLGKSSGRYLAARLGNMHRVLQTPVAHPFRLIKLGPFIVMVVVIGEVGDVVMVVMEDKGCQRLGQAGPEVGEALLVPWELGGRSTNKMDPGDCSEFLRKLSSAAGARALSGVIGGYRRRWSWRHRGVRGPWAGPDWRGPAGAQGCTRGGTNPLFLTFLILIIKSYRATLTPPPPPPEVSGERVTPCPPAPVGKRREILYPVEIIYTDEQIT